MEEIDVISWLQTKGKGRLARAACSALAEAGVAPSEWRSTLQDMPAQTLEELLAALDTAVQDADPRVVAPPGGSAPRKIQKEGPVTPSRGVESERCSADTAALTACTEEQVAPALSSRLPMAAQTMLDTLACHPAPALAKPQKNVKIYKQNMKIHKKL